MDPSIQNQIDNEKRRKQEYLKMNIIEQNFDPELFINYLIENRLNGEDIDNWNFEELETMVELYKREIRQQQPSLDLHFKLEDMELFDEKSILYCRKERTPARNSTIFSDSTHTIQIKKVGVIDSGLFYGKSIIVSCYVYPLKKSVIRTEEHFRWLFETIYREFPQTPIPPLMKITVRAYDDDTFNEFKVFYERFLNDIISHSELKFSKAMEIFCTCESKEEFEIAKKEVESHISRSIFIERNMSKKRFEGMKNDIIKLYPTPNREIIFKVSHQIRDYLRITEEKFRKYEPCFERLETINLEYEKVFNKLLKLNKKSKEVIFEMEKIAKEFNSKKETKYSACLMEDLVFSSISNFFSQQG